MNSDGSWNENASKDGMYKMYVQAKTRNATAYTNNRNRAERAEIDKLAEDQKVIEKVKGNNDLKKASEKARKLANKSVRVEDKLALGNYKNEHERMALENERNRLDNEWLNVRQDYGRKVNELFNDIGYVPIKSVFKSSSGDMIETSNTGLTAVDRILNKLNNEHNVLMR